jgi:hypothetical protein
MELQLTLSLGKFQANTAQEAEVVNTIEQAMVTRAPNKPRQAATG